MLISDHESTLFGEDSVHEQLEVLVSTKDGADIESFDELDFR